MSLWPISVAIATVWAARLILRLSGRLYRFNAVVSYVGSAGLTAEFISSGSSEWRAGDGRPVGWYRTAAPEKQGEQA